MGLSALCKQQSLGTLEFMVSVDMYLNETTRHAHVILPPPTSLARAHYDLALYQLAVHNVAHYSAPVLESGAGTVDEWKVFLRLAAILGGQGAQAEVQLIDDMSLGLLIRREVATAGSRVEGRDPGELLATLKQRHGPERMLDFLLRTGPYGDGFGAKEDGLSLAVLEAHLHGVDLGPLQPRIPEVLRTPSGIIELAPPIIVADVERLRASMEEPKEGATGQMLLIGRRDLRSNNSWMHNLYVLTKGKERCTLLVHPDDAARLALCDGESARVTSRAGSVKIPIEVTDAIMPGVVSIPHGWGHNLPGTQMRVAKEHAGVNANILTVAENVDPLSGNAILNGVAVTVEKVARQTEL